MSLVREPGHGQPDQTFDRRDPMGPPEPGRIPDGPATTLSLGSLARFQRDPLGFLTQAARAYGPVVRLSSASYLVNDAALIQTVLQDKQGLYEKIDPDRPETNRSAFPRAVMNSSGEAWRAKRRGLQPAFHRDLVAASLGQTLSLTRAHLAAWRQRPPQGDCRKVLQALTLDLGCRFLIDADVSAEDARHLHGTVDQIMALTRSQLRLPAFLPSPRRWRLRRARQRLDQALAAIIARHHARQATGLADAARQPEARPDTRPEAGPRTGPGGPETGPETGPGTGPGTGRAAAGPNPDCLLSRLLAGAAGEDVDWLRDELATMILSGLEPMADALAWTFHLLSTEPALQEALWQEGARAGLGAPETAGAGPADALGGLALTEAVVKEALRLYPPAWMTGRIATRDTTLGGYAIPKGTFLLVSQWVMHRDPSHFADPDRFQPQRWLDRDRVEALPRHAYFPFGGGARACIGQGLAMQQLIAVTALTLQDFRLEAASRQPVTAYPALVLQPRNVHIAFRPRRESGF